MWQDRRWLWTAACFGALLALGGAYLLILGAGFGPAKIDERGASVTPDDLNKALVGMGVLLLGGIALFAVGIAACVACFLLLGRDRGEERGSGE